jgi:hypothetical protein
MIRAALLSTLLLAGLGAGPAGAQTMYGGYDIGPNFGPMIEFMQRQQQMQAMQMQAGAEQIIRRAMQDPVCQAHYQAFLQRGGQMPFPNFAYQCAATANFSPEGMQRYWQTQRGIEGDQAAAQERLRRAEQERAAAQGQYRDRYGQGQAEQGRVMQGYSTFVNPNTGQQYVLPYMGAGDTRDPNTGQVFRRDQQGNQYVWTQQGWQPLAPAR